MRRLLVLLVGLLLAGALVAGCGGDDDGPSASTTTTTPSENPERLVNDEEALKLARLLQRDYDAGGAKFVGDVPFSDTARVRFNGEVDWKDLRGTGTIQQVGARGAPRKLFWSEDHLLLQQGPSGKEAETFIRTPPNPEKENLDFYVSALALLSSPNIDNVALIRDQGARFVRKDDVDGVPVDVFTISRRGTTIYWVDAKGDLLRVQLDIPQKGGRATFTFTDRGPKSIELPPRSSWVEPVS